MTQAILACDVFKDELERLVTDGTPVYYLEMGLHDNPDKLRRSIQNTIRQMENNPGVSTIVLAYGLCGNGLVGVRAGRCRLVIPRAHDCISILLGSVKRHQQLLKDHPGTYFYSPGWIRGKRVPGPDRDQFLRQSFEARYSDDTEFVEELLEADRESFQHYCCAAYIDIIGNHTTETYCRTCAAYQGWKYKKHTGDGAWLKGLVNGDWNQDKYLIVESGKVIGSDANQVLNSK